MKWKNVSKGYIRKNGNRTYSPDANISIYSCILMYRKLMKAKKVSRTGAASKRLMVLEYRYQNGERVFKNEFTKR